MKKTLFLAAFALLALVACDKNEQSSLVLDGTDVQTATITGQVTYNPGGVDAKRVPADSVEVRVLVANSEYSAGVAGDKQFGPVFTDSLGMYNVLIPVGGKTLNAANVKVQVMPTQREYTNPNDGVKQKVFYTSDKVAIPGNLSAGDVIRKDVEMKPQLEALSDYTSSVKISGMVTVDAGIQKVAAGYEKAVKPYANSILKVKAIYDADGNGILDDEPIDLKDITTDAEGKYEFEVPAGDAAANVEISTVRFDGEYTKEVLGEYKTITVYYQATTFPITFTATDVEKRNQNFTVTAFDETADLGKEYTIKKIKAVVKTYGEVYDEESTAMEEVKQYKWDEVYLPFNAKITLTCPDFDAANPGSQLVGNELIFTATAATKDGAIVLNNIQVYNAWEGYDIVATINVEDLLQPFKHIYYEYDGFNNAAFKRQTWQDWHSKKDLAEPLSAAFWSSCWYNEQKTQNLEGYYSLLASVTETISATTLKYYSEYEFVTDAVMNFNVRDPKTIMGVWNNPAYNTRNEKDDDGNYTPFVVTDKAVDKNSEMLIDLTTDINVLQHDKYQAACLLNWRSMFPYLW